MKCSSVIVRRRRPVSRQGGPVPGRHVDGTVGGADSRLPRVDDDNALASRFLEGTSSQEASRCSSRRCRRSARPFRLPRGLDEAGRHVLVEHPSPAASVPNRRRRFEVALGHGDLQGSSSLMRPSSRRRSGGGPRPSRQGHRHKACHDGILDVHGLGGAAAGKTPGRPSRGLFLHDKAVFVEENRRGGEVLEPGVGAQPDSRTM